MRERGSFREEGMMSHIKCCNVRLLVSLEGTLWNWRSDLQGRGAIRLCWCSWIWKRVSRIQGPWDKDPEEMLVGAGVCEGHTVWLVLWVRKSTDWMQLLLQVGPVTSRMKKHCWVTQIGSLQKEASLFSLQPCNFPLVLPYWWIPTASCWQSQNVAPDPASERIEGRFGAEKQKFNKWQTGKVSWSLLSEKFCG